MKLAQLLSEEVKNPTPEAGQTTVWDGNEWQLTRIADNQLGWFWKIIGGKKRPYGNEMYFRYDEPIFSTPRYLPKKSQELKHVAKPTKDRSLSVPSSVVDADTAWEYIRINNYAPSEAIEHYLKVNPRYAALYAMNISGKRFYAAEPYIVKDPYYASKYAKKFNLVYDQAKQQFNTGQLEAVAMPPAVPPAQIAMAKLARTPDDWYAMLNGRSLETAYGLPTGILRHMIEKESSGNPHAVSHRGAKGLFQIMPPQFSGFHGNPFDPNQSILYAAKTLRSLANHFDTWGEVLGAYNWGFGNVRRHGIHRAPEETRNYLKFFHGKGIPLGNVKNSVNDVRQYELTKL
jgi:soluble lytic murein transglycosylase-like protein